MPPTIRRATNEDVVRISEIYNYYVDNSTCTFQLTHETVAERRSWLEEHDNEHPAIVAEVGGVVAGWASLSAWNSRCAYSQTGEISVYIDHRYHRKGIGRALVEQLIGEARKYGYHVLIGGACTEQTASIRLQESMGFQHVALFREVGYKFDRWLDVTYLQLTLD